MRSLKKNDKKGNIMNMLFLILGILLGIILMKFYLFFKKEKEISNAKVNDIVITKDNKVGILKDYHRNLDYPSIDDYIIYIIEDTKSKIPRVVGKSMIWHVIKCKA